MRLRFRGVRWDASAAAASVTPSSAQIGALAIGTPPNPVLPLKDVLEKEGVPPQLSLPLDYLPRPQASADLASWSWAVATKRDRIERDAPHWGPEGPGDSAGVVEEPELEDNNQKKQDAKSSSQESPPQECHQDGLAALSTAVCCVVGSDPAIAIESDLSFLEFLLADRQLRAQLLSQVGIQLGEGGRAISAGTYTNHGHADSGGVEAIDVGHDRSLNNILGCLRKARALPGAEDRCLSRIGPECAPQLRFEPITVDFDELEQFPRARSHPGGSSNGAWCSSRVGADETNINTESTSEANRCQIPGGASWSIPVSSWDALNIAPLLKQCSMPRLSELTEGYALSRLWATPAEPRTMRVERPTRPELTRRRGASGDHAIDVAVVANTQQAFGDSRKMAVGGGRDLTRIHVTDSAGYGDLHLQTAHKGLGLLDVLGDAACGIYVDAIGTATFDATAAAENSYGNFQPDKPSPGTLRHTLFPQRYPQIPLAAAGATFGGGVIRGQQQTQRPAKWRLGVHGEKENPQRRHQSLLAVLSDAIRESETVSSSSLSSNTTRAGLDFTVGKTGASTRFERPTPLTPKAVSRRRDTSNVVTNGLLVYILASWRKYYAQAYRADAPATSTEPQHRPGAIPRVSQLPTMVPSQPPPTPPTLESSRQLTAPPNTKTVSPEDTRPSQLGQASSTLQRSGQPVKGAAEERVKRVEPVEPVRPVEPIEPVRTGGTTASIRTGGWGAAGASTSTRTGGGGAGGGSMSMRTDGGDAVGASASVCTEEGGGHGSAASEKPIRIGEGGSEGRPSPCPTHSGRSVVLDSPESQHREKATHLPAGHRTVSTNQGPGRDRAVSINEGTAVVEPSVDRGRKRRRLDEVCPGNNTGDVIRGSPRRRCGGDGPDETGSTCVDPNLAKRKPGERLSLPSLGVIPHRSRRMRASTGSVLTPAPFQGVFQATEGQQDVDPRLSKDGLALPLLPANDKDGGRQQPSPGAGSGQPTVPTDPSVPERQAVVASSQPTEVRRTPGGVTQAHQPRPPESVASPPHQAAVSSVKKTPGDSMDDIPVVAPPWMGRTGDCTGGQENPKRSGYVVPAVSTASESNKSPVRCQGTKGPGGEDLDDAMAGCGSQRQRDLLAMIRAGSMEGTFAVTRGFQPSGHTGKGARRASAPVSSNAPPGRSGPGSPSVGTSFSAVLAGSDPEVRTVRSGNRLAKPGKQASRPLYAVVSEEFVGKAGSLVMALSMPQQGLNVGAAPFNAARRLPETVPGARRFDRFALLELPVEPPVDLIVGGRSAVVIIDNRDLPSVASGDGRGRDPSGAEVSVSDGVLVEAEMAEAKKKLHLLTLQTLKYSTLWIILRMDKARGGGTTSRGGALVGPAFERLEQWLVGFPCRVLIRYSSGEAQLAELIAHAALSEQRSAGAISGTAAASARDGGHRRRVDPSPRGAPTLLGRSPLEVIEGRSRDDPDWAAVHHRQAWFLQLFPALNAYSASALLSSASLKHLIVAPFEELAPCLLGKGRGKEGGGGGAGAARGGVSAESLRDFCAAVRLEEGPKVVDMTTP